MHMPQSPSACKLACARRRPCRRARGPRWLPAAVAAQPRAPEGSRETNQRDGAGAAVHFMAQTRVAALIPRAPAPPALFAWSQHHGACVGQGHLGPLGRRQRQRAMRSLPSGCSGGGTPRRPRHTARIGAASSTAGHAGPSHARAPALSCPPPCPPCRPLRSRSRRRRRRLPPPTPARARRRCGDGGGGGAACARCL